MALKRKRSESELSGFSFSSSPSRPNTAMETDGPFSPNKMMASSFSFPRGVTPSHLPSRTFKRFRDSRPSDEEVHRKFYEWRAHHRESSVRNSSSAPAEHTLDLLYSAQQQQSRQQHQQQQDSANMIPLSTAPSPVVISEAQQSAHETGGAQRTLHSFWNIPSAPSSTSSTPTVGRDMAMPLNCDDCGAGLGSDGGDAMDVDGDGSYDKYVCGPCWKTVCERCSVNLGPHRRCLQCAGRKVWVGGIGWTMAPDLMVR